MIKTVLESRGKVTHYHNAQTNKSNFLQKRNSPKCNLKPIGPVLLAFYIFRLHLVLYFAILLTFIAILSYFTIKYLITSPYLCTVK